MDTTSCITSPTTGSTMSSTTSSIMTTNDGPTTSYTPETLTLVILKGDKYSEWATKFWNSLQAKQKIGSLMDLLQNH